MVVGQRRQLTGRSYNLPAVPIRSMTNSHRLLPFRATAALPAALLLSACAAWTGGDAPPRTSVSLSSPGPTDRSERLQRLVATMDAEAFPQGGPLVLKLSYRMAPAAQPAT
jgi:hypothetical protein